MNRWVKGTKILLFSINSVGIVGALLEALLIEWRGLSQPLFWGGLLVIGAVPVLCCSEGKGRKGVRYTAIIFCLYVAVAFLFRETILNGLSWSSQKFQLLLSEYYGSGWSFQHGMELLRQLGEGSAEAAAVKSFGLLMLLCPFVLLTGFVFVRGKWQIFLAEDILWFVVACITDVFPSVFFLVLCVTGIVLTAAAGEFKDSPRAWLQASVCILGVTLAGIALIYRWFTPVLNRQYELRTELRHEIYVTVNYKWLPRLQSIGKSYGIGSGVDVTGAFGRRNHLSGSTTGVYGVTVYARPRKTLYLRGFVGARYGHREWEPEEETALEQYYHKNGFVMPEDSRDLLNINYEAMQGKAQLRQVRIEELLARGSYSLLPYGALVSEEYTAHDGGTVERLGQTYDFWYWEPPVAVGHASLTEEWQITERQYRQYVYDSFLDYPADRLPRLTEALEKMEVPQEGAYGCAAAIIDFLDDRATYQPDAASTPLGEDFVEYFLFESGKGYCAHFASAAVLMFRYFGIPARYATGYCASPQSFYEEGDNNLYTAVLDGSHAHAWAEIYVDGVGWVPVEATPGAVAFSRDNRSEMLTWLGLLTEDIKPTVAGSAVEDEEEEEEEEEEEIIWNRLPSLADELEEETDEQGQENVWTEDIRAMSVLRLFLMPVLFMAAATVLAGCIRYLCWKRRLKRTDGREKIFLFYRNIRNALHVMGCSRHLILTGNAFWEKLQAVLPSQGREEYEVLCLILEQSAFGNRAPSQEEIAILRNIHDEMVERLYLKAPFYKRPAFAGIVCCMPDGFRFFKNRI